MTLYEVKSNAERMFLWAESTAEAKEMFDKQAKYPRYVYCETTRVWASNTDSRYRGYVVQEDK